MGMLCWELRSIDKLRRSSMETGLNLAMTQLTINNGFVPNAKD